MALQMCEIVLSQDATHANALHLSGLAHKKMGEHAKAISLMRKSVASVRPDPVHIFHLATTLMEIGRSQEALAWYERFATISPNSDAWNNLGVVLINMGRYADALAPLKRAVKLGRKQPLLWINYAVALENTGNLEEAEMALAKALALQPRLADAELNLANVLAKRHQPQTALTLYEGLIEREAHLYMALVNCAGLHQNFGRNHIAEPIYRRAIALDPEGRSAWDSWLFCMLHSQDTAPETAIKAHRGYASQFETPLLTGHQPHPQDRDPTRCLQVGIVSADLRNHVVASFIEPLLLEFSRLPSLKLHAYANHGVEDDITARLKHEFDTWSVVISLSEDELAAKIRADGIDILIDLSGHTAGNRLLTFARKPAPLQVSWLGYPGTTGLTSMDYYFGDKYFLPHGLMDDQFSEKIVQLPASVVFRPFENAPPVSALPAFANGHITFGSFSHLRKISRTVVALWAQLMQAVPDSRLLLAGMPKDENDTDVRAWFEAEGIDGSRLTLHPVCPLDEYLALHHLVDIHLDPFPYNGGTTTWHAIWMGVPSLSLAGATPAGRSGASILGLVGLQDFVVGSKEAYVAKGIEWAGRLDELSVLRAGMRDMFARSLPGQPSLTARGIEQALRMMWRRWCQGLAPESFEVTVEMCG